MCGPILPLAGAVNTLDQTRRNVQGWYGKEDKPGGNTSVTNNYYGKNEVENETPAKNKNTLKVNPK